jgi:HAD superfamily hydrolase (TIGR01493 family)
MPELGEIEAIAFDAYGTLFDVSGATWAKPEVVQTARMKQLQYSWHASLMGQYKDFKDCRRQFVL